MSIPARPPATDAIAELDARCRRLTLAVRSIAALWLATVLGLALVGFAPASHPAPPTAAMPADSILRVRGLVVVDELGVERVWIGAPVPDPLIYGRRATRLGGGAGILLFDGDGTERSGYLTTGVGEVFLTLDAAPRQAATFLANATGGANLFMRDPEGNSAQIAAVRRPILKLTREGEVVFSLDSLGGAR